MSYQGTLPASSAIRLPSVAMPRLQWPHLSQRARALLMMGIMISPCFLSDAIGYCVQRFFYTADEIAMRRAPDEILTQVNIFHVACPDTGVSAEERGRWATYAVQHGWL